MQGKRIKNLFVLPEQRGKLKTAIIHSVHIADISLNCRPMKKRSLSPHREATLSKDYDRLSHLYLFTNNAFDKPFILLQKNFESCYQKKNIDPSFYDRTCDSGAPLLRKRELHITS